MFLSQKYLNNLPLVCRLCVYFGICLNMCVSVQHKPNKIMAKQQSQSVWAKKKSFKCALKMHLKSFSANEFIKLQRKILSPEFFKYFVFLCLFFSKSLWINFDTQFIVFFFCHFGDFPEGFRGDYYCLSFDMA